MPAEWYMQAACMSMRPCVTACCTSRYPFLLVDRVVEVETEKYAIGYKNVTVNDQFFNGHFPERAIMPGERLHGVFIPILVILLI